MQINQEERNIHSRLSSLSLCIEDCRDYCKERPAAQDKPLDAIAFRERWFGNNSEQRVKGILRNMQLRFDRYPEALTVLSQMSRSEFFPLICHWHLQLADPLYRAFTGEYLVSRRMTGNSRHLGIDKEYVFGWLSTLNLPSWSLKTKLKMSASLMTAARQAGMIQNNEIAGGSLLGTDKALGYWFYLWRSLHDAPPVLNNPYLASIGLSGEWLDRRITKLNCLQLRRLGDTLDWEWKYPSLIEYANAELGTVITVPETTQI